MSDGIDAGIRVELSRDELEWLEQTARKVLGRPVASELSRVAGAERTAANERTQRPGRPGVGKPLPGAFLRL